MSTELYIRGYSSTGEDGIATYQVLEIFGVSTQIDALDFLPLNYDEINACELSIEDVDGKAVGIVITRPCGHERFWEDVFRLLARGPYIAFIPCARAPVLVNKHIADDLPEGIKDALGAPTHVATPEELKTRVVEE